jgi:hypothetical protein
MKRFRTFTPKAQSCAGLPEIGLLIAASPL